MGVSRSQVLGLGSDLILLQLRETVDPYSASAPPFLSSGSGVGGKETDRYEENHSCYWPLVGDDCTAELTERGAVYNKGAHMCLGHVGRDIVSWKLSWKRS